MTAQELLKAAEMNRPDLMKKTAQALAYLERISPKEARAVVSELHGITDLTMTKMAASPVQVWGAAVGGTLLSGLAASLATDLYDSARRGLTKSRNFKGIMEANPELKKYDKKRINDSFDALHRYAPEFTADPILGGTLLKAVAEVPGNEHVVIKDLISARKNLQEARHTQYRPGSVGIELERDADIARDTADHAIRLKIEKDKRNFETQMDAVRAGREKEKQMAQFQHDKAQGRRDAYYSTLGRQQQHELAKALEEYKRERGHTQYWHDDTKFQPKDSTSINVNYKPVVP